MLGATAEPRHRFGPDANRLFRPAYRLDQCAAGRIGQIVVATNRVVDRVPPSDNECSAGSGDPARSPAGSR